MTLNCIIWAEVDYTRVRDFDEVKSNIAVSVVQQLCCLVLDIKSYKYLCYEFADVVLNQILDTWAALTQSTSHHRHFTKLSFDISSKNSWKIVCKESSCQPNLTFSQMLWPYPIKNESHCPVSTTVIFHLIGILIMLRDNTPLSGACYQFMWADDDCFVCKYQEVTR